MKKRLICLLIISFLIGCKKSKVDNDNIVEVTPLSPNTKIITQKISAIISNQISLILSSGNFDFTKTLQSIKSVEGVKDVSLSPDELSIIVTVADGTIFNFLITTREDRDQFSPLKKVAEISQPPKQAINQLRNITNSTISDDPNVFTGKKILILAPFQRFFNEPLSDYTAIFPNSGITFKVLCNEQVTLDVFKKDFLQDYDFIYIATHGNYRMHLQNGQIWTGLATGIVYDAEKFNAIPKEERDLLGITVINKLDESFLSISVPYLEKFNTKKFNHSFIFANACSSYSDDDLANYFGSNGVSDFAGYTDIINTDLGNLIGGSVFMNLALGAVGRDDLIMRDPLTGITSQYLPKYKTIDLSLFRTAVFSNSQAKFAQSGVGEGVDIAPDYGSNGQNVKIQTEWLNNDDYFFKSFYYVYNDNSTITLRPVSVGQSINIPNSCGIPHEVVGLCTDYRLNSQLSYSDVIYARPIYYFVDFKQSGTIKKTMLAMYLSLGK